MSRVNLKFRTESKTGCENVYRRQFRPDMGRCRVPEIVYGKTKSKCFEILNVALPFWEAALPQFRTKLFMPQRLHRIDTHGSASRDVTGHNRHQNQNYGCG